MPPETESVSPISCELCRQRKCKCDRNLPFCSQCTTDPSKCSYPESGKRGLPLGYINQLEIRLADTELALYETLATLRAMNGSSLIRASRKGDKSLKQKAARMEEWGQLPLGEPSDLERWLEAKSDQFTIMSDLRDAQRIMPLGTIESINSATQRRDPRPSNMSGMSIGTDSLDSNRLDRQVTASNMQTNRQLSVNQATSSFTAGRASQGETSRHGLPGQIQGSSGEVIQWGGNQIGKAGQLSKMYPAIYF